MKIQTKRKILASILIFIFSISGIGLFFAIDFFIVKVRGEFPNPFRFNDGSMVDSVSDWNIRREEIKQLIQDIEYGSLPPRPDSLNISKYSSEIRGDGSRFDRYNFTVIPSLLNTNQNFSFRIDIYIPIGSGPFPAIINVGKDGAGSQIDYNQSITSRGYVYACFYYEDLDPDEQDGFRDIIGPAQRLYLEYDWGSIGVWAWGAMRVVDFLVHEPWVDSPSGFLDINGDAIVVTGHSRRGKTALLAAALDERIDMVDCNGGGTGGGAAFRVQGGQSETLFLITSPFTYFYWFKPGFGSYAYREHTLPIDQHYLRALVAPRIMLTTDGIDDLWANPLGVQAVYEAAQPVFDYLGAGANNYIHFRNGGHGFLEEDFTALLDIADNRLLGQGELDDDYYMTPFNMQFPINY